MVYEYKIQFEKNESNYRLISYNTPWDNDRELEDIRLIFEGKDLQNNDLPAYKVVDWETLKSDVYDVKVHMRFILNMDGKSYDQLFKLVSLEARSKGEHS